MTLTGVSVGGDGGGLGTVKADHGVVEPLRVLRVFGQEVEHARAVRKREGRAAGRNGFLELCPRGPRRVAPEKECRGKRLAWIVRA